MHDQDQHISKKYRYIFGIVFVASLITYTWHKTVHAPLKRSIEEITAKIAHLNLQSSTIITDNEIAALEKKVAHARQEKHRSFTVIDCSMKAQAHGITVNECRVVTQTASHQPSQLIHLVAQGKQKALQAFFNALVKQGPLRIASLDYTHDAIQQQCNVTCMLERV